VHGRRSGRGGYRFVEEVDPRIAAEVAHVDARRIRQGFEREYPGKGIEPPDAQGELSAVCADVDDSIKAETSQYAVMLGARSDARTQDGRSILWNGEHAQNFG